MNRIRSWARRFSFRLIAILVFSLLMLLLTGLFRQTQVYNISEHYQIVENLRALQQTNLETTTDALKVRLSIAHNYDALAANRSTFQAQQTSLDQLFIRALPKNRSIQQTLAFLAAQASSRNVLIEDFKADNSVLQNSTRYFPKAVEGLLRELSESANNRQLYDLLNQLSKAILRYSLEDTSSNAAEIEQTIEQIKSQQIEVVDTASLSSLQSSVKNICLHAETILRLKPETTQAIARLANASTGTAIDQTIVNYENYHRQSTELKNRYRLLLYLIVLLLMLFSLYLSWTRRNAAILRRVNLNLNQLVAERTQDLKETIEKLKRSQAQLIQAEKMSGLGQLAAGVAHEINNPICFIYGNVQAAQQYTRDCLELVSLYEQHYPDPVEDIQEFTESIDFDFVKEDWGKLLVSMQSGTTRVKKIVESLRNFSRLDESGYKAIDIHEGIESTLLLLNHRLERTSSQSIEVVRHYGDLPKVDCHAEAINQVFMNVLNNAVDALSNTESAAQITIATMLQPEYVQISIADNGSGIPKEVQSKIFDPFFTTKPVGQGTGLGLTTSYQTVVEAHQGRLEVTSTTEKGTEIFIQLPRSQ